MPENKGSVTFDREEWLAKAVTLLRTEIIPSHYKVPHVWVSIGWPRGTRKAIGQCYDGNMSKDGLSHIFISPAMQLAIGNPKRQGVLDTLVHEIGHAWVQKVHPDAKQSHGAEFRRWMQDLGLEGKPTATVAGTELTAKLRSIATRLGSYGHGQLLDMHKKKKEATRLIKLQCRSCGYTVRGTQKWIDGFGYPICPCNGKSQMLDEEGEEEEREDD